MADKAISELVSAEQITATDLFVLQQDNTAKKLTGQILLNWLTAAADGHGGIQSVSKLNTSGLADTYRITLADQTVFDFVVTNGRGVISIVRESTSGLTDTYRISYNDGASGTFTVTNGEKGDKGDTAYIWIKYASQQPTESSNSMGDIPDEWMGIYFGFSSVAPADWQQYGWYKIKGEKGDTGTPATLISAEVTYQTSVSGTIIPSGVWQTNVPVVSQGNYLWTRTVYTFNTGDPVTQYSVSRFGLDGSGAVSSVAGISPDPTGNVPLKASDVGAVSRDGDSMEGPMNMNGQTLSGLNAPTGLTEPVTLGYAEENYHNYENRIDNSDFTRFVAQAGVGGKHGTQAYAGDRWILDSGTVTGEENRNGDGYTNINLNGTIRQIIADPPAVGTVFVEMASGTAEAIYENGEVTVTSAGGIIKNVALYEGEFEEDTRPVYQPKGYAAEWMECLRYFLKPDPNNWNFAFTAANGAYLVFEIPCPVKMRVLPSIVSQGALKLYAGAGWNTVTVSSWTRYFHGGKYSMFASKASVSGIDISTAASYMMTGTPALSADL